MDFKIDSLIEAAKRGDAVAVKNLIDEGVDLNVKETHGNHAIHFAAIMGRNSVIETLLNTGKVSINSEGSYNRTALHCAVRNEHLSTIELLLAKNADCTAIDDNGSTPLHYAFYRFKDCCFENENNVCKCIKKLDECGSIRETFDEWPPSFSKKCLFLVVAELLISNGNADISIVNQKGEAPLDVIPDDFVDSRSLKSYFRKLFKNSVPLPTQLRDFIKEMNKEMTQLKVSKQKYYEEMQRFKNEEIEQLKENYSSLQTLLKKKDEEIMTLKQKINSLENLLETKNEEIEKIKTSVSSLKTTDLNLNKECLI